MYNIYLWDKIRESILISIFSSEMKISNNFASILPKKLLANFYGKLRRSNVESLSDISSPLYFKSQESFHLKNEYFQNSCVS